MLEKKKMQSLKLNDKINSKYDRTYINNII